jgi:hypothetical protein
MVTQLSRAQALVKVVPHLGYSQTTTQPSTITKHEVRFTHSVQGFPISHLPPELRHQIYRYYFASLPVVEFTLSDIKSSSQCPHPHLSNTPLALSSPFFNVDIPISMFYKHATFQFSCPSTLKSFSETASHNQHVRHIKVRHGQIGMQSPDWVFALNSAFERLYSVDFAVDNLENVGEARFVIWWTCVKDALRESAFALEMGTGSVRPGRLLISVEDEQGDCVISEYVGGLDKMCHSKYTS